MTKGPGNKGCNSSSMEKSFNSSSSKSSHSRKSHKSSTTSNNSIKQKSKSQSRSAKLVKMPPSKSMKINIKQCEQKSVKCKGIVAEKSSIPITVSSDLTRQMQLNIEKQAQADRKIGKCDENWDGKFTLESKLSDSFRSGSCNQSLKLKLTASNPKGIFEHGSVFTISKVKNDDSAMNLLSQTIRDDIDGVKKEETEIFVPGKGEP